MQVRLLSKYRSQKNAPTGGIVHDENTIDCSRDVQTSYANLQTECPMQLNQMSIPKNGWLDWPSEDSGTQRTAHGTDGLLSTVKT